MRRQVRWRLGALRQEKLRLQTGWLPLAFALDWQRPPRQMNGTRFFAEADRPQEVVWRDDAPVGKLDPMVDIDFRMSTTSMYADIVLPTATWYEKNDLNTTDMHPFIHRLTAAVDPAWEARTDWSIFRTLAAAFSAVAPQVLGVEKDVVLTPIQHETPSEVAQPYELRDWGRGECEPVTRRTMPAVHLVERNYPDVFARFTSLGPALEASGNGSKGHSVGHRARGGPPRRAERPRAGRDAPGSRATSTPARRS